MVWLIKANFLLIVIPETEMKCRFSGIFMRWKLNFGFEYEIPDQPCWQAGIL